MRIRGAFVGLALLCLGACGGGSRLIGRSDLSVVKAGELPPPTATDLIAARRAYSIGPLDQLSIDVYGIPELSRAVQVDAGGKIAMPLIGSVDAAGKEPSELSKIIQDLLAAKYVRDPKVTVNLTETNSQLVTVDGEVRVPGPYTVAGRMTLMRAIAKAQGLTEFAKQQHVVVFRRVNNQEMAALFDLGAIRQGVYADPEIFANDVVLVGDSHARRVFKDAVQLSAVLGVPLLTLIR